MNDDDLTRRALRAYFRTGGAYADQPSGLSGIETADNGRDYVVLSGGRSDTGICAVYSVRAGDRLRRLKRWPRDLNRGAA